MSRSKKVGSDLELQVMAALARKVKELPTGESRERVANWFASQTWGEPEAQTLKPEADPRQTTIPALS